MELKWNKIQKLIEDYINDNRDRILDENMRKAAFTVEIKEEYSDHITINITNNIDDKIIWDSVYTTEISELNLYELCKDAILGINTDYPIDGYTHIIPTLKSNSAPQ